MSQTDNISVSTEVQQLKVLTLNCWGVFIPVVCKLKRERMQAIADALSTCDYDIVMLQEVWTQADYVMLRDAVFKVLPYSHYFHSGNYGSGVCIFSKHLIYDVAQFAFTVNGYPHRVLCGDWFCRKCIGLCRILVENLKVNVYSTHLHAQYRHPDDYESHRIAQSFEMSQYINHTSEGADLVVVGGDLNYSPSQLGYKVIRYCADLQDAWIERSDRITLINSPDVDCDDDISDGYIRTSNRPDNSFYNQLDHNPSGQTLDFILFRSGSGYTVECKTCYLTMQRVPRQSYNYSDHEGVAAVLNIKPDLTTAVPKRDKKNVEETLNAVLPILDDGIDRVQAARIAHTIIAALVVLVLVALLYYEILDNIPRIMEFFFTASLLLGCSFCVLMATLWTNRELNGLLYVQSSVKIVLKYASVKLGND